MSVVCTLPAAPKPEHDGIRQARNELWFDVRIRAHLADLRLRLLFAGEEVDDRDVVTEAHRGGRDHARSMQLTSARRSHVTDRCRSALSPAVCRGGCGAACQPLHPEASSPTTMAARATRPTPPWC